MLYGDSSYYNPILVALICCTYIDCLLLQHTYIGGSQFNIQRGRSFGLHFFMTNQTFFNSLDLILFC